MEYFWNNIMNKKQLKTLIKTRKSSSAHGIDGLSNALFTCATKWAAKYFKVILKAIKLTECFPEHWKDSKVVLIYKHDDPDQCNNWRPISITTTSYIIIMMQFACAFQNLIVRNRFISDCQKGFIKGTNGCLQHSTTAQELINQAFRSKEDIFIASIDLTNAFGEIPHKLIFNNLKAVGFDEKLINIAKNCYKDSTNIIQTISFKSKKFVVRKGVKQGCPLSPLLFDLAIDPLLRVINAKHKDEGFKGIAIQAYADDLLLISKSENGLKNILETVDVFCNYAKLKINVKKCGIYSYMLNNNRRVSSNESFKLNNQEIPKIQLLTLKEYLGAPIARSYVVKMIHSDSLIKSTLNKITLIQQSHLKLNQKIDAIKRFIIPSFDYELTCNNCKIKDLINLNKEIRKMLNNHLQAIATPIAVFHTNWKNGGLGIQDLTERARILYIKSFLELNYWSDSKVTKLFKELTKNEMELRDIHKNDEDSIFLDWNLNNMKQGTQSLCIKALKSAKKLNIEIKKQDKKTFYITDLNTKDCYSNINGTKTLLKVLNKIVNLRWTKKLTSLPLKGHSFNTLIKSSCSSFFLNPIMTKANDNIVRFAINGRCNNLPTGEILAHKNPTPICPICHSGNDNLKHRINACLPKKSLYKIRHNNVVEDIIKAIDKNSNQQFVFHRSTHVHVPNMRQLEPENNRLLPDIWFIDNVKNQLTIIEVSIPYGDMKTVNQELISSLDYTSNVKTEKYKTLCEDCQNKLQMNVKFYPIIVSTLGAVSKKTFNNIKQLLNGNMKDTRRCARDISYSAIKDSALIYWGILKRNNASTASTQDSEESRDEAVPAGQQSEE